MVCKEDVLSWFKDLEGYKRIDVLYDLLTMCLPFELRFLGTCIEDLGKHSYQELWGPGIKANDFEKMSTDSTLCQGLLDEKVRHRVLIYLSLLSSRNYCVANWLYKNVLRTEGLDNVLVKGNIADENVQSEFLLLFVMALHHPAFTFEHKLYFHKTLIQLIELGGNKHPALPKPATVYTYSPKYGHPLVKPMVPPESLSIPIKTALTVSCVDDTSLLSLPPQQHIPGIPHTTPPPPISTELGVTKCRPLSCGEVPRPFPPPALSPHMNEQPPPVLSPIQSRTNSPHRSVPILRNPSMPKPSPTPPHQPPLDIITTQIPLEMLSSNNFSFHLPLEGKLSMEVEDQLHSMQSKPNGYRFLTPSCTTIKTTRQLDEQFSKLNMDGEMKPLQRSNSSSSSSLNQSPPETPSVTPLTTTSQCSSRGEKPRVNGMPPQQTYVTTGPQPGVQLCDTTSPPPPTQFTFNSCSVPYPVPFTTIPTRSYHLSQYRPPFPFIYQTNENSTVPNTVHHPYIPSTIFFSHMPIRPASNCCYNCGLSGHVGQECTGQNLEDIAQSYTLDYSSPPLSEK